MNRWETFAAKLGLGLSIAGFVLIFLGWNGAASSDRITSQFPYLISGGIAGLALVVLGAALIIAEAGRDDRDQLRDEIKALRDALEGAEPESDAKTNGKAPQPPGRGSFVGGETTYHLPSCRLLEGRGERPRVTLEEIATRGLVACRVCEPENARR